MIAFPPRSIRARVFLGSMLVLAVAVGVVALAIPGIARDHELDVLGPRLQSDAQLAADLALDGFRQRDPSLLDPLARRISADAGLRVTFIAVDGVVLGESDADRTTMEDHATRPEVIPALHGSPGRSLRHSTTLGRDLLYVAVPVRDGDQVIGVARVALPLIAVNVLASRLVASLAFGALVAIGLALVLSWLVARAITLPIERITARAEREEGIDGNIRGPEEVQRLAGALRRADASLREQRAETQRERDHLAALIDDLADAIFIADRDGRIELANAAARASAGDDVVGRDLAQVVREHEALEAIAAARDGREHTATVERADPRRFLRVVVRPLAGQQLLIVVQDLTNLRRLETMRSDFVANVSHELRRPIGSLKAMAETLEEGALDDPAVARDFVARMHREIDGLAQLVNELLTLTRLESRTEALDVERRSPAQLLNDAARRMGPLATRAGITMVVENTKAPDVRVDPERIGQVLANLLHNAVKFTPAGGTIRLGAADGDGFVTFHVTDTGAGIAQADLERIFERFFKTDRARSTEGTGLGLAIAKHVVQAHGGHIEATSAGPGHGATFRFTLPKVE